LGVRRIVLVPEKTGTGLPGKGKEGGCRRGEMSKAEYLSVMGRK